MTTTRRETLARIYARADVDALGDMFVVSVGAGFVGSTIASELVKCGVGHIALVDGDHLEPANLVRHVLGEHYLWANKAEALADHLSTFPGVDVGALNRHIDASISDTELDALLHAADLIVIATDDNGAQRRVAARALALDIPTVIPSLYPEGGGEVFVGLGPGHPCQLCWDAFRRASADVRAVTAISADGLAVIQRTVFLCLAVLTPEGPEARDLAPTADDPRPRQVFIQRPGANLVRAPLNRRDGCETCAVGPSPLNDTTSLRPRDAVSAFLTASTRPTAQDWSFILQTRDLPEVMGFTVSDPVVLEGDAVTVSWDTRHTAHVEIDGFGRARPRGELTWVPERSGILTLRAYSPLGVATATTPPVRVVPIARLPRLDVAPLAGPAPFTAPPGGIGAPFTVPLRASRTVLRSLSFPPPPPSLSVVIRLASQLRRWRRF